MQLSRLSIIAGVAASVTFWGSAAHADAAAGKATFTQVCSECHEVADFEGENAAELQAHLALKSSSMKNPPTGPRGCPMPPKDGTSGQH